MKRKACKECRIFVKEKQCPVCKGTQFTTTWRGRINIIDSRKSDIAKRIGFKREGEYAIKTR